MTDNRKKELEKLADKLLSDDQEMRNLGLVVFERTILDKFEIQFVWKIFNEKKESR